MAHSLTSLAIFQSIISKEKTIRSLHVYESMEVVEREFLFERKSRYVEKKPKPLFLLEGFLRRKEISLGSVFDTWRCIFVFRSNNNNNNQSLPPRFPPLLCPSRNPKLEDIPNLANDLKFISELKPIKPSKIFDRKQQCQDRSCDFGQPKMLKLYIKEERDQDCEVDKPKPRKFVLKQDLNCLPDSDTEPDEYKEENSETESEEYEYDKFKHLESDAKTEMLKKKRTPSEHVARLSLEELSKYFGVTIVEASKNLNIGLTVLKRKCREFGIPRWPHRKIKSLDSLINDLQEEAENQQEKNEEAAMVVAKRKKKLETEKRNIVKKPFMEIQIETKRFRQDNFKKRHRASRAKTNQESLATSSST